MSSKMKMESSCQDPKRSLVSHLTELRRRLIISLAALFVGMGICFFYGQEMLSRLLMAPLERLGQELVLIAVTEGFQVQIKIAFIGGLVLASPIILWHAIAFVLPALRGGERRVFWPLFISSVLLFVLGIVFAYLVVLDLALQFLLVHFSVGLNQMLSAGKYLSFLISFLLPFGIIFEIPIMVLILTKMNVITPAVLRQKRRYVIIGIFIIAAVLTPPDVVSQVLLALPMLLLYEVGVLVSALAFRHKKAE